MGMFTRPLERAGEMWDTVNHPPLEKIDQAIATVENAFNWAGYVPVVSQFSGELRYQFGQIQLVLAAALGAFTQIRAKYTKNEKDQQRLYQQSDVYFQYAINGFGNMLRGRVEQVQMLYSVPMAIALAIYDLAGMRFNYPFEKVSAREIPLLRSFVEEPAQVVVD